MEPANIKWLMIGLLGLFAIAGAVGFADRLGPKAATEACSKACHDQVRVVDPSTGRCECK